MISWLNVAPFLALPGVLLLVLGLLPNIEILGNTLGGGLVRQWFVNHTLLPLLPTSDSQVFVNWYMAASWVGEVLIHALVALNLNAILLPVLFVLARAFIGVNNWAAKTDLDLKRASAKR